MKQIQGSICASIGFKTAAKHCGVKTKNKDKLDVAIIVSDVLANTASVYTKNKVQAAPILITKKHLENHKAQAIIVNSGNANACAINGELHALSTCQKLAQELSINESDVVVASTGVIGQEINVSVILEGIPSLVKNLNKNDQEAAAAIMTTDTTSKSIAYEFEIDGKTAHIGAIAKGSGMIHPNMGTMLCFITTDVAINEVILQKALLNAVNVSFNRVSVDGDSSTNDMCTIMANGLALNQEIVSIDANYQLFYQALETVCIDLAKKIAADGEGANHLITCVVNGAPSILEAETMAKSVIASSLVKTAIFGSDANWGRVICAMGYSGVDFDPNQVSIDFASKGGKISVCQFGKGLAFSEDLAKKILLEHNIVIEINLNQGNEVCTAWGCDLSYDYVKINGDYRS